jgi:hypothetical protein
MKNPWILACVLLFVTVAAFAQTPSRPPLTREALTAILGLPAASSCATQPSGVRQVAKRPAILGKSLCNAMASCGTDPSVSCSGSTSCIAVDADCTNFETGYVTCDGVTKSCPTQCNCDALIGMHNRQCCNCAQTGDCIDCCRCDGGGIFQCSQLCS